MENPYREWLSLSILADTDRGCITGLTIQIDTRNSLIEKFLSLPHEGEYLGLDSIEDFTSLPKQVRTFLQIFKSYQHNQVRRESASCIIIGTPVETLFWEQLLNFHPEFKMFNQIFNLNLEDRYFKPSLVWESEADSLALEQLEPVMLLQTDTQAYVINRTSVRPVLSILNHELLRKLFQEKSIALDYNLKERLLSRQKDKPDWAKEWVRMPSITDSESERILFYIDGPEDGKLTLRAFFANGRGADQKEFPFRFEDVRKAGVLRETLIIPFGKDTVSMCRPGSALYDKAVHVAQSVRNFFFEFLNEVQGNTIVTQDSEALFQKFLPAVRDSVEIHGRDTEMRVVHGSFTDKRLVFLEDKDKIDWLEVKFEFRIEDLVLNLEELTLLLKDGFIRKDGALVSIEAAELETLREYFSQVRVKKEHDKTLLRRHSLPMLMRQDFKYILPESLDDLPADILTAQNTKKALRKLEIDSRLEKLLRDYQKTGVYWLSFLNRYGFGGILADEMGLGKTIQVLTFLLANKGNGTALIICPTTLIYNWVGEIQKFIGLELSYTVIDGAKAHRQKKIKTILDYDIAITSYPLAHMDSEEYEKVLFNYCILDEAQHIKNKRAKRTLSIKGIKARNRIAVTGTPIENNVGELWSLFDFVMPDYLGNHAHFKKHYENSLNSFDVKLKNKAMDKLKSAVKPFILRRTKSNVLQELPEKIEQDIVLELTEKQKAAYLDILSQVRQNFLQIIEKKGLEHSYIDFLSALTRLRQICLHPGLIKEELLDIEDASIKLKALLELIYEVTDSGHRVVVFSQFVEMLKIIRKELHEDAIDYLYLDGKTKNRIELVNHFNNSDVPVFLISLKAGGTGLNLIGADSVILFDPWWNPAVENQAIDRVHRIGQHSTVNVYRLVTKGTIEEKIRQLQERKKEVFDSLVTTNQTFIRNMDLSTVKDLLSYDKDLE